MKSIPIVALLFLCRFHVDLGFAQPPFYADKTINVCIRRAAGELGGYATRAVTNILRKYIPGNPVIIVQNMAAGGDRQAANHVYRSPNRMASRSVA